ncbi:MAG: hypothetical protein OEZ22_02775 [Spirochaetia bacterium]|nr:hypothetical protein [Spirochaetia bacterium]
MNFLKKNKLIIFFYIYFSFDTFIFSEEIKTYVDEGGYIGINLPFLIGLNKSEVSKNIHKLNTYHLEFNVKGASGNHDIITEITILKDIIHFLNYYSLDTSFLKEGEIYDYSFFELKILNKLVSIYSVNFYWGYSLGHKGFLTEYSKPSHIFYIGIQTGIYWFIDDNFLLSTKFELPLNVYKYGLNKHFSAENTLEFAYDPLGPIKNPLPHTAIFSVGLKSKYYSLTANNNFIKGFNLKPFASISILY